MLKQPSVSKHLMILKRAELVHSFKRGLKIYYYVADCEYTPHEFLDALRKMKEKGLFNYPDFKPDFERYSKAKKSAPSRIHSRIERMEKEMELNSLG